MTLSERKLWSVLISVNGIGKVSFRNVLRKLEEIDHSLEDFWHGSRSLWKKCGLGERERDSLANFQNKHTPESFYQYLQSQQIEVVTERDECYPELLQHCEDRPVLLFVKGDTSFWNQTPIAVVGSRNITPYGEMVTRKLVSELVSLEATIISGFMYGVDVEAHLSALACNGQTVGVLGYGFQHIYPRSKEQRSFYREMLEKGATFVTEFAPHVTPVAGNFPTRNRIIAGMSLSVVVTEAAEKSGSHITVDCALEYGRDVCAVPGPITSEYSEGTKWLINQGARLVSSGYEVLQEVGAAKVAQSAEGKINKIVFDSQSQEKIYKKLQGQPLTTDELSDVLSLDVVELVATLSTLEISGLVQKSGEAWIVL